MSYNIHMPEIPATLNLPDNFCYTQCVGACCDRNIIQMSDDELQHFKWVLN